MTIDRNNRIEQQDARDLYLLISECRSLGGDGINWRRHLVDRLPKLFDADMVFFVDTRILETDVQDGTDSPKSWARPTSIIDNWPSDAGRIDFLQTLRDGRQEHSPVIFMNNGREGVSLVSRHDVCPDLNEWHENHFYLKYFAPRNMDEFVHTENQGQDDLVQTLTIKRELGRPPFPRKIAHMMRALWVELRRFQPHELHPVEESAFMDLPKRMLQVLACILTGANAKEAATQLDISVHTVQEHIKRLYKRSGASNRTELANCYRDIAPILVTMPLDKIPELHSRSKASTQKGNSIE